MDVFLPVNDFICISQIANQGLGVVALRDIENNFPVLEETAVLRMPWKHNVGAADIAQGAATLERNILASSKQIQTSFAALHGDTPIRKFIHNCAPLQQADLIFDLGQQNSIIAGIFLVCSRLNHSCIANSVRMSQKDSMSIVTVRPIKKGEQLTISYIDGDILLPSAQRALKLQSRQIPQCMCSLCLVPAGVSNARLRVSDENRSRMVRVREKFLSSQGTMADFQQLCGLAANEQLSVALFGSETMMKVAQIQRPDLVKRTTEAEVLEGLFRVGVAVRIHKLVSRPELNGVCGVVTRLLPGSGRCGVTISDPAKKAGAPENSVEISVKFENLLSMPSRS
jgi:hypothetical protein